MVEEVFRNEVGGVALAETAGRVKICSWLSLKEPGGH